MSFREKSKNARAFIVLLAALIALLLNMKYDRDLVYSLLIVIAVIIIFFIISTVAIKLIEKITNMEVKLLDDEASEEQQETESDDESD